MVLNLLRDRFERLGVRRREAADSSPVERNLCLTSGSAKELRIAGRINSDTGDLNLEMLLDGVKVMGSCFRKRLYDPRVDCERVAHPARRSGESLTSERERYECSSAPSADDDRESFLLCARNINASERYFHLAA